MPATLDLIAKKGITFNRYYVSYPLCCPSRVSLLDRPLRHNHKVQGNVQPNGGFIGFSSRAPPRTTSPPGCRPTATAPSMSARCSTATATHRWTPATSYRPAGRPGTTIVNVRLDPLSYGYRTRRQRPGRRPVRRSGGLGNPRIRRPRRHRLPVRADQRPPLLPRHRRADQHRDQRKSAATPADQPLLSPGRLHRPARRLPPAGRARAHAPPLRLVPGRDAATRLRRRASTRATSPTSPGSSAKPTTSRPSERHTYLVYWQKQLESLRDVDDGVRQVIGTLGAVGPARATPTSSSPPTTGSSSASTGCSAASSSPTSRQRTCRC